MIRNEMPAVTATSEGSDRTAADRSRLERMYLTHGSAALRLAFLLTGNRPLAEDIAQDAFARIAGRLAHLRDPAAFGAYLRQTVVNLVRMHWRRERLERTLLRRHHEPSIAELGPDLELYGDLWRGVQALPPRQRAAIVLHYYEDLPQQSAADVLGCRPSTYRSLVAQGMKTLRERMGGERDD